MEILVDQEEKIFFILQRRCSKHSSPTHVSRSMIIFVSLISFSWPASFDNPEKRLEQQIVRHDSIWPMGMQKLVGDAAMSFAGWCQRGSSPHLYKASGNDGASRSRCLKADIVLYLWTISGREKWTEIFWKTEGQRRRPWLNVSAGNSYEAFASELERRLIRGSSTSGFDVSSGRWPWSMQQLNDPG